MTEPLNFWRWCEERGLDGETYDAKDAWESFLEDGGHLGEEVADEGD